MARKYILVEDGQDQQQNMLNELFDALYCRLDAIGIPDDCATRKLSWDEAACLCANIEEEADEDGDTIKTQLYVTAYNVYQEASELWVNIENARNLF